MRQRQKLEWRRRPTHCSPNGWQPNRIYIRRARASCSTSTTSEAHDHVRKLEERLGQAVDAVTETQRAATQARAMASSLSAHNQSSSSGAIVVVALASSEIDGMAESIHAAQNRGRTKPLHPKYAHALANALEQDGTVDLRFDTLRKAVQSLLHH